MKNAFGHGLRELRRSKGVSQQRLADLTLYKRTNISGIENGKREASNDLIQKIAEVLNIPYETLYVLKVIDSLSRKEEDALYLELHRRKTQHFQKDGQPKISQIL